MKRIIVILFSIFAIAELQAQQLDTIKLPADLQVILDNYEQHWSTKNHTELAALFTEDGFVLSPGHEPVRSKKAIARSYEGKGGPLFLVAYDYGISGDLAYIVGGYSGAEGFPPGGKFTLILKKEQEKWLIHSDMDNGN